MLIDRTHRAWMVATLVLFGLSLAAYIVYARSAPDGPQGGTVPGLVFGIAGTALMIFAGLLSGRKKLPGWRLGSAQFWLRGHIWLGLLSGPLILFHAGFQWGGLLEQMLLVLTMVIIVSGVIGLGLQQVVPRAMSASIASEAMYEQLPAVCQALCATADRAVTDSCGASAMLAPEADDPKSLVAGFYRQTVRPFLHYELKPSPLVQASASQALFGQLNARIPSELQSVLTRLEQLCNERRQLLTQERMHRWMHGWLMLHVPLSAALLVLGVVHAVTALWY